MQDLENRLQKSEKYLREKEHIVFDLQKQISMIEKQMNLTQKDSGSLANQKNALESRLKVLQQNIKNLEKDKEKLGCIINKKDQLINKLEIELESIHEHCENEKLNSSSKLDEINNTLKELTLLLKNKEQETELLRANKTELQVECQKLLKIMLSRDNEILELKKKVAEYDKKVKEMQEKSEKMLKDKMEESFCSVINYIEEKENEIDQLKRLLNQKDFDDNYLFSNDSKRIIDLEGIIMTLTQELRVRDDEIKELKLFVDNYKNIYQQIETLAPNSH